MTKTRASKLIAAERSKALVRFTRRFEAGSVNGYVLNIGPQWFLLAFLSDDIRFNGFQCFRLSDVRQLQIPPPHVDFVESALRQRNERVPKKPRVKLERIEDLLWSANRKSPLITIHREKADPGVCEIGRVVQANRGRLLFREIDADAKWDAEATPYRLNDITRVDFGGDYEEALHLVGGYLEL